MLPSYLEKLTIQELHDRAAQLKELLINCRICPNSCEIDRTTGELGECNSSDDILISSVSPHFGEEPPLVGQLGSGTIFFTNCNLSCIFCQNYDISQLGAGHSISITDLAEYMLALQSRGCHNINLVSPTHYTAQIVEAISIAVENGLELPIVYNCGGYESVETLKLLENIIDIYMPDIKYSNDLNAAKYSGVKNYWEVVTSALKEMHRQVGDLKVSKRGIAQKGLLVRHLVLPNDLAGSKKIIEFIAKEISQNTYLNVMGQYRPSFKANEFNELNRSINSTEYLEIENYARSLGLIRGLE